MKWMPPSDAFSHLVCLLLTCNFLAVHSKLLKQSFAIHAQIGTTSSTAVDPLLELGKIAKVKPGEVFGHHAGSICWGMIF